MSTVEVDVWVRGTPRAATHTISEVPANAAAWSDADVHRLLSGMLRALEREKNPEGDPPPVTLRGFSWIVSPYQHGGVVVHLEMQLGTASAGPFQIEAARLTTMIEHAMQRAAMSPIVH